LVPEQFVGELISSMPKNDFVLVKTLWELN
jgi:hypothetical protein